MKFSLEIPNGVNQIHAYDNNSIVIKTKNDSDLLTINTNLIVTPDQIITDRPINQLTEISVSDINYLTSLEPEVLILTQKSGTQLLTEIVVKFAKYAIGVELMPLGAACRTYNLLVSEGRKVVLVVDFD